MVIAIDGPGGVGKSTVARAIAARLGVAHLDTGATYRAATLAVLEAGVDPDDGAAVLEVVEKVAMGYGLGKVYLDGRDVSTDIRSAEVTAASSIVSARAEVRSHVVDFQRLWVAVHGGHAVVEGRDIGTVVFPNTPAKVFLTASPEIRAARRAGDAQSAERDVATVAAELGARDRADSTRAASPLRPADDAVVIDTSDLSIDEVVDAILAAIP